MAVIWWGTHVFNSNKGYHGEKIECPECGRVYAPAYVKSNFWFHIEFIPLIPYKSMYRKFCPVCGYGVEMKGKEGKAEIKEKAEVTDQAFEPYVNHNLADKPKGILTTDNSYEFHVKDLNSGEDFCVAKNLTKDEVKKIKKGRAYKKLPINKV
jgi:ribosomal protein S27AE